MLRKLRRPSSGSLTVELTNDLFVVVVQLHRSDGLGEVRSVDVDNGKCVLDAGVVIAGEFHELALARWRQLGNLRLDCSDQRVGAIFDRLHRGREIWRGDWKDKDIQTSEAIILESSNYKGRTLLCSAFV